MIKIEKDKDYDKENNENELNNKIKRYIEDLKKEINAYDNQISNENVLSNIEKLKEYKEKIEKKKSIIEENLIYV